VTITHAMSRSGILGNHATTPPALFGQLLTTRRPTRQRNAPPTER
jgi:hypothetical protein